MSLIIYLYTFIRFIIMAAIIVHIELINILAAYTNMTLNCGFDDHSHYCLYHSGCLCIFSSLNCGFDDHSHNCLYPSGCLCILTSLNCGFDDHSHNCLYPSGCLCIFSSLNVDLTTILTTVSTLMVVYASLLH